MVIKHVNRRLIQPTDGFVQEWNSYYTFTRSWVTYISVDQLLCYLIGVYISKIAL